MSISGELVSRHHELDDILEAPSHRKPFISDWNCVHPFYRDVLNSLKIEEFDTQKYNYVRAELGLNRLISEFHLKNEKTRYSPNQIIVSNGSATIISAFLLWLKMRNVGFVYYIPPLYYTFHFFSKIYDISLRPITKYHMFDRRTALNLPSRKSVLLFTDPIWYAGCSVKFDIIARLMEWQQSTHSLVFIDGSFQYFKWNYSKSENTSAFSKNKTLRLICPSKAVATHGLRFSYLLLPSKLYRQFDFILENSTGSSNPYDIKFAEKCMEILLSNKSNNELVKYTKNIYRRLSDHELISASLKPDCGYFIFARLNQKRKKALTFMDGKYFEQYGYEDYVRINLLSPYIRKVLSPMVRSAESKS